MIWWGILLLALMAAAFVAITMYAMFKPGETILFVMVLLYWALVAGSGGVGWNLHNKCDTFEPGTDSAGMNAAVVVMTLVGAVAFVVLIILKIMHKMKKFRPSSHIAQMFEGADTKKGHTSMIILLVILAAALVTSGTLGEVMYSKCQTFDDGDDPDTISGQRWFEVTTICCAGLVLLLPIVVISVRHYRKAKAEKRISLKNMGSHPLHNEAIAAKVAQSGSGGGGGGGGGGGVASSATGAQVARQQAHITALTAQRLAAERVAQQQIAARAASARIAVQSQQSAAAAEAKLRTVRRRVAQAVAKRRAIKAARTAQAQRAAAARVATPAVASPAAMIAALPPAPTTPLVSTRMS